MTDTFERSAASTRRMPMRRFAEVSGNYRVEILIFLLIVVFVGPVIHEYKAQQASRYVFTAAMVDDGTIKIDRYAEAEPKVLGVDRAVRDGHTYSDKAPLQPVLAIPFYGSYRLAGGHSALEARYDEHLGLWWITLWMATIPAALLAVLTYRFGLRYASDTSAKATLALVVGSILLPFSALLFGHVLAAAMVFGAFVLLATDPLTPRRLVIGGLVAGAAVATEYTAAVAVVVLTGYAAWRARWRTAWFVLGGLPAAIGLGWYHTVAFGSPLAHPYRYSAFSEVTEEAREFFDTFASSVRLDNLAELFFDGRGFLLASPIVLVGLIGLVLLVRRGDRDTTGVAVASLLIFLSFLVIPLFWGNPWGGDSPGPRYMLPAFPFLALGVAVAWRRIGLWARAATVIGGLTMVLATFTDPLLSDDARVSIGSWVGLAAEGDIVPTVFTIAIGPAGWLIHLALIALVGWRLVLAHREQQAALQPSS